MSESKGGQERCARCKERFARPQESRGHGTKVCEDCLEEDEL